MNRTTNNKTLLFIIAALLLTNIGVLLYCFVGRNHGLHSGTHEKRESGLASFLEKDLGFDKGQLAAFDSLKQQHRGALRPYFEQMAQTRDSLYRGLGQSNLDDSALDRMTAAVGARQAAIEKQFFRNFQQLRSLCRPEQVPKFDSLMPGVVHRLMTPARHNNGSHRAQSTEGKEK